MKKHENTDAFEATEQTILALLRELQEETPDPAVSQTPSEDAAVQEDAPVFPLSPHNGEPADDAAFSTLFVDDFASDDAEAPTKTANAAAPQPKAQRTEKHKAAAEQTEPSEETVTAEQTESTLLQRALRSILPHKGDPASELVRKGVFLLSLAVFICSLSFLLYYTVLEPRSVQNDTARFEELYTDTDGIEETTSGYDYPAGMQATFRRLYDVNADIAGWLSYTSNDASKFLNISQPVVHCDNNDTYLTRAFDGSKSRSGTLFFDKSNTIARGTSNRVSIIYGHNMASGMMLARLNKLLGNVYYARSAPLITLNTLYENNQYKVFAVIVNDEGADPERYFSYLRTSFVDDSDFLNYVAELRARSLYDYPVEVDASDELLILSTCTNKSQVKVADGRMAVIARRVRADEDTQVSTASITDNTDVIMPYGWYTAQGLTPHDFYTQTDYHLPTDSAVAVATTTATGTATVPTAETTAAAQTTAAATGTATPTTAASATAPRTDSTAATATASTAATAADTAATDGATTTAATTTHTEGTTA